MDNVTITILIIIVTIFIIIMITIILLIILVTLITNDNGTSHVTIIHGLRAPYGQHNNHATDNNDHANMFKH